MNVRDEDGAVLILALAFLAFGAIVIGALLSFASTSVLSTERLRDQRNAAYAADGATDAAIQLARTDTTVGAYADPRCQSAIPTSASGAILLTSTSNGGTSASVICTWSADQFQPDRTVTFTAFVAGTSKPIVEAQVLFHDDLAGTPPSVVSWTYCQHGGSC